MSSRRELVDLAAVGLEPWARGTGRFVSVGFVSLGILMSLMEAMGDGGDRLLGELAAVLGGEDPRNGTIMSGRRAATPSSSSVSRRRDWRQRSTLRHA